MVPKTENGQRCEVLRSMHNAGLGHAGTFASHGFAHRRSSISVSNSSKHLEGAHAACQGMCRDSRGVSAFTQTIPSSAHSNAGTAPTARSSPAQAIDTLQCHVRSRGVLLKVGFVSRQIRCRHRLCQVQKRFRKSGQQLMTTSCMITLISGGCRSLLDEAAREHGIRDLAGQAEGHSLSGPSKVQPQPYISPVLSVCMSLRIQLVMRHDRPIMSPQEAVPLPHVTSFALTKGSRVRGSVLRHW